MKSLDGLRGIAIVMVFFFHFYPRKPGDPVGLLSGAGWMGVDLFFVLSGFLITGILYDTLGQRRYFLNFFARRALRLFPVYFLMIILIMSVGHWLGVIYTWWDIPYFLYAMNIVGDLHRNPGFGVYIGTGHIWSLAVEEQFYLLWAPAVFFLKTKRRILLACATGAIFSIALRWFISLHADFPLTPYDELPTRLDGLLCGGALAIVLRTEKGTRWIQSHLKWRHGVTAVAAVVVVVCVAVARTSFWSSSMMIRFGYIAIAALFGTTVLSALVPGTWVNRIGQVGFLRLFGRYSYGFYLWHQIPDKTYREFLGWVAGLTRFPVLAGAVGFAILFAFNMGLAALSYHGFELYFLRMKRYFAYDDERERHRLVVDEATTAAVV